MKKLAIIASTVAVSFGSAMADTSFSGRVLDANGQPIIGAVISPKGGSNAVVAGHGGRFSLSLPGGTEYLVISCEGFQNVTIPVEPGTDLKNIQINLVPETSTADFLDELTDLVFDESVIEDEDGTSQNITALTGAQDNIFYSTASYNFGPMYYRFRGYDSRYQTVYINGIEMNDIIRGRFNFSTLLGMTSRAFRNKTTTVGIDASAYGFGNIGGSVNYNTVADTYSPGFNGSVAYTNSNYMLRAMATYSTGLNKHGWAFTVSAIGRYANEGVIEGTFYNSAGLFMAIEKRLNANNSLTLTAFGGPTQRATSSATYQEAYDLAGSNLYNPNWGYYQGKKRAARITETFDPTVMLNWVYKKDRTVLNTAASVRWVNYSNSAIERYKANDPNPTYYRYLPSYYKNNPELYELYTYNWEHNVDGTRQIKWDDLYYVNYLNNEQNKTLPESEKKGSSYIMENRHSNQFTASLASYINHPLTQNLNLQGGVSVNYTNGSFYKTIRDLMGGEFWIDIDPFSDREIALAPSILQNNLDDPNRRVKDGDKFGYDYNMYALRANAWLQNTITLPRWDVNYGINISYTQYQRDGHMRNGRAPLNSLGKGQRLSFDNASIKAGATYKINGRNFIIAHAEYGSLAPLIDNIYIAPRIKDNVVNDLNSERILSGDISYMWNYRRFRSTVTAYYTQFDNATERSSFYDDRFSAFTNFVLSGVKRVNKGVEVGMAFKITPSLTATFAGTYSKYQYKNNPQGTRSFENGLRADTTQTVYLKNFYAGSTPQTVFNLGIDWAAPKGWFFNINGTWQGDAYVNLSPVYHEALPNLWELYPTEEALKEKIAELSAQDKLKDAFSLNVSIGKIIYINRKVSLNINVNANNVLNNRNVVTYAYQQGRMNTNTYDRNYYPNRYSYAQGIRLFVNVGVRF